MAVNVQLDPTFKFFRKNSVGAFDQIKVSTPVNSAFPVIDYSYEYLRDGGCGAFSISANADLGLTYNDQVQIYLNGVRKFCGFISDVPKTGTTGQWDYEGYGYAEQLDWTIAESFIVKDERVDAAILRLLSSEIAAKTDISSESSGVSIALPSSDGWDGKISNMEFGWKTPAEILRVLLEMCGDYEFGVDENRKLYFRQKSVEIGHRWFVGTGNVKSFEPDESSDGIKNFLYVDTGKLSNGQSYFLNYQDAVSIKKYGRREDRVSLPDAFPVYSDTDLCEGLTPVATGFAAPTGEANMTDGDATTCFESNENQVGACALHSKLESAADVTSPSRGTGGMVIGSPTYAAGKFNNGIVTSAGNYIQFPTADNDITHEKGTIEFWFKAPFNSDDDLAGARRDIVFTDFRSEVRSAAGKWRGKGQCFGYDKATKRFYYAVSASVSDWFSYYYTAAKTFSAGDLIHLQYSWDNEGADLAQKVKTVHYQSLTGCIWYNGTLETSSVRTKRWNSHAVVANMTVGADYAGNNYAGGVIDNLKTYDSPLGDASGKDTEGSNQTKQYITIDLGAAKDGQGGYAVGKIRLLSCTDDESEYYARGVLIETSWNGTEWREVFRKESNSETDLIVTLAPDYLNAAGQKKRTRYIRVSLLKSDDVEWKVYSLEAYEFVAADVDQWAAQRLKELSVPTETGSLVLEGVSSIPEARGKCSVTNQNGAMFTYEISKVSYSAKSGSVSLDLGDLLPSTSDKLKDIYRKLLQLEYQQEKNAENISSGDAIQAGAINPGQIGRIIGDQIRTGSIRSRNYSATSGLLFDLDNATLTVNEADGLTIQSGGGVNVGTDGNIRGGQTAYNTGTGFWLGNDGAAHKFSIGNPAGNYLTWDGTNLTINGATINGGAVTPSDLFIVTGTYGSGTTLTTAGAGTRLIFYSKKAAFRAGYINGTQWNDANIGEYSVCLGGGSCTASGDYSATLGGGYCTASGASSATLGGGSCTASGDYSATLGGRYCTASGDYSATLGGRYCTASGTHSIATNLSESGISPDDIVTINASSQFSILGGDFLVADQDTLGTEKVTNGTFDADTDWTKGTGWTISDGKAIHTPHGGTKGNLEQEIYAKTGATYRIQFTVSDYAAGSVAVSLGGTTGRSYSANGIYNEVITATNADPLYFVPAANTLSCKIDAVSVKQITGGNVKVGGTIHSAGIVYIGTDDTTRGVLYLYGDGASQPLGGAIRIYNSADYDGTFHYWSIRPYEDALQIGPDNDTDALIIGPTGNISATAGTINAAGGFKDNGVAGIDTTFLDADGNTITVSGGIITAKTAP